MKKFKFLWFILISFLIGFIFTFLVYMGLWSTLIDSFRLVPFWVYVILIPIVFYITLTCHELGHLIAFRVQGVKIRALYLTIFVFYKNEKGWHVTVKPKLWVLFGGLVIPDLPHVKNEKELTNLNRIFARALITAPIVTIVIMSASILSFLLVWIFGQASLGFGVLTIFMIYTTLLSSLYIYTFRLNTKHLYGDFVAYKKMKEDPIFQFAEITQYISLSLQTDEDYTFLYQKAQAIIEAQPKITNQMFLIVTLMTYLEGVIEHQYPPSMKIDAMLNNIVIQRFMYSEEGLTLLYTIAAYHYYQGHVDDSYQLLEKIEHKASKRIPEKLRIYLKHKYEHMLHIAYHQDFLANNDNIYVGQSWLFEAIEDPYETAKKDHIQLPFQHYVCDIPEEKEKMPSED